MVLIVGGHMSDCFSGNVVPALLLLDAGTPSPTMSRPKIPPAGALLLLAFRRAGQFGVQGNWSRATGEAFRRAIEAHVRNPNTLVRQGFYRGQPATHFYDPQTGWNVIRDAAGNFWSAWRLDPSQAWHLLRSGRLGGG